MDEVETIECPFCLEHMQAEDRGGVVWLVCPNGCPTEMEAPERKPVEAEKTLSNIRPRAAGAA